MTDTAADVKNFGAVGDGVTDDTAAIQAAINSQRDVYLPNGNYLVSSTLSIPSAWTQGFSMVGECVLGTTITYTGSGACFQTDPSTTPSTTTRRNHWYLANLYISGPGATTTGTVGLLLNNALAGMISNVHVTGFATGVRFDGLNLVNGTACYYNSAFGLHCSGCGTAVWFAGQANSNQMFGGRAFSSSTGVAIDSNTNNINLHGVDIESNTTYGITTAGYGCQFIGCRLENPAATYEVVFNDSGGGVNGTKNTIIGYWTTPTPSPRISWDATQNNTVIWPGQFNDLRLPDAKLAPSTPYAQPYTSTVSLLPTKGNNPNVTATGNLLLTASPTGALDGQEITCSILASGATVYVTTAVAIKLTTGLNSPFGIPAGKVGFFTFRYSSLLSAWVLRAQTTSL